MASSTGEAADSSNAAPLPATTMEAKMIVAIGHDDCQKLKDVLSKEDPSTMVVVMASSNQTATPPKPRPAVMDSRLLAVACSGSWKKLESFVKGEDVQTSGNESIKSSAMQPALADEEALLPDGSFLEGVTMGGDTFLHVMATNSDGDILLEDDSPIRDKAESLLFEPNNNGDTPLHCAARAANFIMVSFLIDLARGNDHNVDRVKELLRKENLSKWTVLHEAVRSGNNYIVKFLMEEDPDLASLPETGTSPLYLAILLEKRTIAHTLHMFSRRKRENNESSVSYSGPNGQNALHAAVLRGKDFTKVLLQWNIDLMIEQDENGSTPLHLAASMRHQRDRRAIRLLLLEANPNVLYQTDNDGSFPIHVAASVGAELAISDFIKESPGCAGLRDARGRTFLHVAVEQGKTWTVRLACRNRSVSWILNMQDNDGNTALHLATINGSMRTFIYLFWNIGVDLNFTNLKGETPHDIARHNRPKGSSYNMNSDVRIHKILNFVGAKSGISRQDYSKENDIVQARRDEMQELDQLKEGTQSLCIGSVLIATVTFGATFAMPGGYRADDHVNGGTPTLAGRYAFDAFTLANALAFTLSAMATLSLMSSGSPLVHPRIRKMHLLIAYYLLSISVTSLVAAFALGTYMMLAPVSHITAIGVCVLSSLVLVYQEIEWAIKHIVILPALCMRKGIVWTFRMSAVSIIGSILLKRWPLIIIFCSTVRNYHVQMVEPSAQSPAPLH